MGTIEEKIQKEVRRTRITRTIVGIVAVAGIISAAAIAPNVIQLLGKFKFLPQEKRRINQTVEKLVSKSYLIRVGEGKDARLRLTQKGERFAALLGEGKLAVKKPRRWDGKWRILIFDIPEQYRRSRDNVRKALHDLGFCRLQDSVWVYPYDCEDFIIMLKADLKVGKNLLYVVADAIENDIWLRRHFELSG